MKLEGKDEAATEFSTGETMTEDHRLADFQFVGKLQISEMSGYDIADMRRFLLDRFSRKDLWTDATHRYYNVYVKVLLGPSKSTPKAISK